MINVSSAYELSGNISNIKNESIYNASVSFGTNSTTTDINGYYNFSNVSAGNYTLKAIRYPYFNKTVNFNITNNTTLNFTMNAKIGNAQPEEDNSPIYIVAILISFVAVASRHRQIENIFEIIGDK